MRFTWITINQIESVENSLKWMLLPLKKYFAILDSNKKGHVVNWCPNEILTVEK